VDAQSMDLEKILCRLDFNHDEKILEQQLQVGPCELIADKIINTEILEKHKHNIIGIIYHINKNDNPDFAKRVMELGISIALVTELSEGEIQPKKINYMDLGLVREIKHPKPKEKELKDVNLNKLFYKSNKITISMGKFYPSKWAWENNLDIGTKDELSKVPDHKTFWKECNNFCFVLETP
jgi:hypothetical protein